MILCDMDGVLATGPGSDTAPGQPIYRTFTEPPDELERIGAAGIPLHVVTAKVEAEASQVLEAIGLDAHIASVIGANRLFWPSVWGAVRRRRLPSSLVKSVYRSVLPARQGRRVVMLEDRRENLREMLAADAIDFGILVPPISVSESRIVAWFDLNLAFRVARGLAVGGMDAADLSGLDLSVYRWRSGGPEKLDFEDGPVTTEGERYLLHLPSLSFADSPSSRPSLKSLDTGRVLMPGRRNVVTTVRAGRRVVRQIVRRISGIAMMRESRSGTRDESDVASRSTSPAARTGAGDGIDEPLRVAIVGAGTMARHHARALSRLSVPNRIVLVFDPDPEQRQGLLELCPEARGYPELTTATLREEADVVHVCSPPATHAALARKALESGCHLYVEKPFASTRREAEAVLSLAEERALRVCAGHQLLFERPTLEALELTPKLGRLGHIESYFAFRPTRSKHGAGLSSDEQLKDVLPHPLYLLLRFLETAEAGDWPAVEAVEVGGDGTVHALIRGGGVVGSLVVTLTGRPVESYLKLVGSNGTLQADYVRGIVLRSIGPGTSAVDKVLEPFRAARQITIGTAGSLFRRAVHRGRGYPGLVEILDGFYRSIVGDHEPPLTDKQILQAVALFEEICSSIDRGAPRAREPTDDTAGPGSGNGVVVTGGTGFLGRDVVRNLLERGLRVRVVSRKVPAPWERLEGAEYVAADLGAGCDPSVLHGFEGVIHCAAETRGGWEEHRRNSIEATEHLLRAAKHAGVTSIVHVSSVAVLGEPERGERLSEETGLETQDRQAGPYVWGKLNAEKVARRLGEELGLEVKIVRPGAIVDYEAFEAPGRLGRRFGNLFVAVGNRRERIGVVDLAFAARTLAWMSVHFQEAPDELNLLAPDPPTRKELVQRLKARNPDLRAFWLPGFALTMASSLAVLGQRVLRRGREPIRLDRVFGSERYDTSRIRSLQPSIQGWARRPLMGRRSSAAGG